MLDDEFNELMEKAESLEHDVRFSKDIMSVGQRNELFRKLFHTSELLL